MGALSDHYGQIREIFARVFLVNHCPLMLLSGERGTNITPDKIGGPVVRSMLKRCDEYLRKSWKSWEQGSSSESENMLKRELFRPI